MPTHCRSDSLDFGSVEGRTIVAGFDGGEITSDGGALLLAKTNKAIRLIERVAPAFTDRRNPDLIEHSVATLVGQRIMGEALGYPDINDHDLLRHDPLLAAVMGKLTARDKRCAPLAGKSTLNRLQHSPQEGEGRAPGRYHKISHELAEAETEHKATGHAARRFKSFDWTTRKSWTRERRVVAKAEWTEGEANPRFIVTSMHEDVIDARALYEDVYCKRGEMENRIKETQSDLFGDRMPATTMRANQLRMYFSALAYVLMCALRRIALAGTDLERATCGTLRLRLLKIGAQVTVSVRRVKVALATSCPWRELFNTAHERLSRAAR
jgi:hypothetical protein